MLALTLSPVLGTHWKLLLHDDLLHVAGFLEQAVSVLSHQVFQSYFVSHFHKTQEDHPA